MNITDNRFNFIVTLLLTLFSTNAIAQCSVQLGNDQTICANQSVVLMPTVTGATGTVAYQWSPTTFMNTTTNGATQANPIVTPQLTTTYNVTITDGSGCTATDAVVLTVSGAGPIVNTSVNPSTICAGSQVNLDFTSTPANCGLNYAGCNGVNRTDSIGLGTNVQPNIITSPTLYGNFYKSIRMQMLYTASEINAIFGGPGTIKAVAWRIGIFNSNATLQDYTIKMTCVPASTTQLSAWQTGLSTVFSLPTYTPTPGWNNHGLQTPFDWDGVSSLVVEICFYNPTTNGSQANQMRYDNVPNGMIYSLGNTDQCSVSNPPTQSNVRATMRVLMCQPDYSAFTINWTPSSGPNAVSNPNIKSPTANPQTTQTYMVAVTQGGGCAGTNYVTVNVDTVTKVNAGADRSFCLGQSVSFTATPSGTPLPPNTQFTYQWRVLPANTPVGGNNPSITVTPTANTSYYVTMNGGPCPVYDTVRAIIGSLPITTTVTAITCNGAANGAILATPTGAAPYSYTWSANAATGNVNQASNLGPGTYTVTVNDNNTCSGTATATLTQPGVVALTAPSIRNTSCNGGSDGRIAAFATGGTGAYTFTWSNGIPSNDTAFNVSAGTYTVTVRDANSCSATAQYTVTQPTAVDTSSIVIKNVRCFNGNDGQITVNPTGGVGPYRYVWSHSASLTTNVAGNLTANTYSVTVFDVNNCGKVVTGIQVTQPSTGLTVPTPTFVPVTCNGGSNGTATANPVGGAGGYEYLWSQTGQITKTAINLTAGPYTVTVTDDSLCTASATVNVSQAPLIGITGVVTDVLCNGGNTGAVNVTVTNGVGSFIYAWSNTASTEDISNVAAATYSFTVTDQTLCTQTATFTVNQPQALVLNPATITNVSCFGENDGAVTANAAGGTGTYDYAWTPNGNTQTISGLIAGTYTVLVTDDNNCTATNQYTVTEPATGVTFGTATVTDVLCFGAGTGSIATSVSGGTGPYNYTWNHNAALNNATAANLTAGPYTVTATDANGCTSSQTNNISQPAEIVFTGQPSITNVSCNGNTDGTAEVFVSGGVPPYTYTWNGNAGTNPQGSLAANTYTVVVTDANVCSVSTALTVTQPDAILITTDPDSVSCFGGTDGSVALTVSGGTAPYIYVWSDNQTAQTATNLSEGNYSVTVTDNRTCTASATAYVAQPAVLIVQASSEQVSCAGSIDGVITAQGIGGTQPWHYILQFGGVDIADNYTGAFTGLNAGTYVVRIEDDENCTATREVIIGAPVADFYTVSTDSTSCFGAEYTDGAVFIQGLTIVNQPFEYQIDGGPKQFSGDFYNIGAGEHTVTATNAFGCITTLTAVVPQPLDATAEIMPGDTIIQVGETIQLFSTLSPYPASTIDAYVWGPVSGLSCTDCADPYLTSYARETDYTVTITYNGICTATASMTVIVDNNLEPYVPNAFTPNGDGNNEVFMIYGEGIKYIDFKIFNRWGEQVYETTNQYGGWDGTYKGVMQNPGVYTYNVRITYLDDKEIDRKGTITLIR